MLMTDESAPLAGKDALAIYIDGDLFKADVVWLDQSDASSSVRTRTAVPEGQDAASLVWVVTAPLDGQLKFFPTPTDWARNMMAAGPYKVGPGYRGCLGGSVNLWSSITHKGKTLDALKDEHAAKDKKASPEGAKRKAPSGAGAKAKKAKK